MSNKMDCVSHMISFTVIGLSSGTVYSINIRSLTGASIIVDSSV